MLGSHISKPDIVRNFFVDNNKMSKLFKCYKCKGEVHQAFNFNCVICGRIVCSKCGYVVRENQLRDKGKMAITIGRLCKTHKKT